MSAKTGIEWTDATWNPVVGCERVSPGCAHCYAKQLHDQRHTAHNAGKPVAAQYAQPFEVVQLKPERLGYPLSWRQPRRIFVNSVSDLFHDDVPEAYIARVFAVMALADRHTFQVLTKRPARMRDIMQRFSREQMTSVGMEEALTHFGPVLGGRDEDWVLRNGDAVREAFAVWPLPNVWLGVSVENQRWADERIPILLDTPAAVRFLSCEPLLGSVDLSSWLVFEGQYAKAEYMLALYGASQPLGWVIAGGESGKGARPMDGADVRSLRDQCGDAGVPFFFKQWGGERDKRGHDDALLDGVRHVAFPGVAVRA